MKTLLCVFTFLIALPVAAYQTGPQNRTNFGANPQQQAGQGQYRSFSNYNRSWGQGVQTQTVQTHVAGSSASDFEKKTPQKTVGKAQAATPKQVRSAQPAAAPAPAQASSAPAALPANVDPAAMMQQVQSMMGAMGNMTGAPSAGATQQAGPTQAGQNAAAMPAGMPDISALMEGALPTAPAAPAKK